MKVLGIIPARGGSKGVPRKNIRNLCGNPLIAWTIEEAKKSKLLTRIIVTTEDSEIAKVARAYGAEIPFMRPKELAADLSTDMDFLTHALDWLRDKEGYEPDIVVTLRVTAPLKTAAHIDEGIQKLIDNPDADAARPIHESPKHPYKMWKISEDETHLEEFLSKSFTGFDEPHNLPRQLFPKVYVHTGAMDIMRRRTIQELKSTSGNKLAYFFMDPKDSVNIDSEMDFQMAEFLMSKRLENK
ncbi:MAG: hypothetical protein A3J67_00445 [Parcubacteria group bacterium RIFCSPHIGHO2_02_FULL_48_10b]|uniref:Acylneuraminate cytidylyltransferase n=1 Tax=Candidatus Wolfebacteria bacterium RIFCSPLOWO2_01_FULL_47_17b TaxID=1802558 RepID=A0A1F8DYR3_9BACT|nr:MAG: hypothetical protein A2935_01580 [Candidatus Wolfebacteria bacterium RIFCSPLOWO2_01_FULL_47_17b]OHB21847.1 MAG: hypothetical protein A3J67_00445 [Parcubacteria group bacterium RIFCSPHIGHO2_02_FULL_48_10b]